MTHADTAAKLVLGDRNDSYGNPADDFACVGAAWSALLRKRGLLDADVAISADMVALMMAALKLVRQANQPKPDNLIDAHGYLLCAEWIYAGVRPQPDAQAKDGAA